LALIIDDKFVIKHLITRVESIDSYFAIGRTEPEFLSNKLICAKVLSNDLVDSFLKNYFSVIKAFSLNDLIMQACKVFTYSDRIFTLLNQSFFEEKEPIPFNIEYQAYSNKEKNVYFKIKYGLDKEINGTVPLLDEVAKNILSIESKDKIIIRNLGIKGPLKNEHFYSSLFDKINGNCKIHSFYELKVKLVNYLEIDDHLDSLQPENTFEFVGEIDELDFFSTKRYIDLSHRQHNVLSW
jgi:hypothetical protein